MPEKTEPEKAPSRVPWWQAEDPMVHFPVYIGDFIPTMPISRVRWAASSWPDRPHP